MRPIVRNALLRLGLYYGYGLFGAWLFILVEKREESSYSRMERMLHDLRTSINLKYNMSGDDFDDVVLKASEAVAAGKELDWTFLNSCWFIFATLTTIGYGNITPKTPLGQGLTILFCIIGLPITVLALKTTGELIAIGIRHMVIKTETKLLKREQPTNVKAKKFLVAVTMIIALLFLASVVTIFLEKWSLIESLYAWFTTFTTIGFGDYIQSESFHRSGDSNATLLGYGILLVLPYLIGLALMSCIITCVVDAAEHIVAFQDKCIDRCRRYILYMQGSKYEGQGCDVNGTNNNACCTTQETSAL